MSESASDRDDAPSTARKGSASSGGAGGEKETIVVKVALVGDSGVGKTSLMVRYVERRFDADYVETLGELPRGPLLRAVRHASSCEQPRAVVMLSDCCEQTMQSPVLASVAMLSAVALSKLCTYTFFCTAFYCVHHIR